MKRVGIVAVMVLSCSVVVAQQARVQWQIDYTNATRAEVVGDKPLAATRYDKWLKDYAVNTDRDIEEARLNVAKMLAGCHATAGDLNKARIEWNKMDAMPGTSPRALSLKGLSHFALGSYLAKEGKQDQACAEWIKVAIPGSDDWQKIREALGACLVYSPDKDIRRIVAQKAAACVTAMPVPVATPDFQKIWSMVKKDVVPIEEYKVHLKNLVYYVAKNSTNEFFLRAPLSEHRAFAALGDVTKPE